MEESTIKQRRCSLLAWTVDGCGDGLNDDDDCDCGIGVGVIGDNGDDVAV